MEEFLQFLRKDVADNYEDSETYVRDMSDLVMTRHDIEELFAWAENTSVTGSVSLRHKQQVIEARMRIIIRRAHAKHTDSEYRAGLITMKASSHFGRF